MKTPNVKNSSERIKHEKAIRLSLSKKKLKYGISFLDEAMGGIMPMDLVLIGARPGAGKTEIASNIAYKNAKDGKKVFGIFLEAFDSEIELRQKYRLIAREAHARGIKCSYRKWMEGKLPELDEMEVNTDHFDNVTTLYRDKSYGVNDVERDLLAAEGYDLVVIDHLHYFDFEDENENRALTQIVKKISDLIQVVQTPVVLVGHLKKQDKQWGDLVPGLDDFHGTSNIPKIATKVVTLAKGKILTRTTSETYARIPKFRMDGSVSSFIANLTYDSSLSDFQDGYQLGLLSSNGREVSPVQAEVQPEWFKGGKTYGGVNGKERKNDGT